MTEKIKTGQEGENLAAAYLVKNGYKIIARNFREKCGEIDIIAKSPDGILVFIEVKTMTGDSGNLKPEDQLTSSKLKKFRRIASLYAGNHPEIIIDEKGWRLDLIAIELNRGEPIVRHYNNV